MKQQIIDLLNQTVDALKQQQILPQDAQPKIMVENTRDKAHGDLATNLAMMLAKPAKKNPRELSQLIVDNLPASDIITKTEIAGPGFINFFLSDASTTAVVATILEQRQKFGRNNSGNNEKVQVEFVSANPTGPLHVGHGRGAAYGATVADLLAANGFDVQREYYVNDAGRQMNILAISVWLRYLQIFDTNLVFPVNGYKGAYVKDYAADLKAEVGERLVRATNEVFSDVPEDESETGGDKELHVDALIVNAKKMLGAEDFEIVFQKGLQGILGDIRDDLSEFGVDYQEWFSERSLSPLNGSLGNAGEDQVEAAIVALQEKGFIYEQKGALWFKSTDFGDDKDRVVKRDNGQTTYFASDIAYHKNKFERGFTKIINIWGADHHGYITRVKAAMQALGFNPDALIIPLVQFVHLYRGGEQVQMSTRSGSFETLRDLRQEVSKDAARFFYVTRKVDQSMDFDLDLAKSESKDNPVYYIQYAHARICAMFRKMAEHGWTWNAEADLAKGLTHLNLLDSDYEKDLMNKLARYPEIVKNAGTQYEPHQLTNYLKDLAADYHTYYNAVKTLVEEEDVRTARLTLADAIRQVIANGLDLLGVTAPQEM